MKYLALVLLICALPTLSVAQCFVMAPKQGMTHCQDTVDLTWHAMGSSWRNSQCMECTCNGCCAGYSTPRDFPDDCVSVFDSVACQYIVHKKNDPTIRCPIFGSVGK